jgi:hypothetical protein
MAVITILIASEIMLRICFDSLTLKMYSWALLGRSKVMSCARPKECKALTARAQRKGNALLAKSVAGVC